MKKIYFLLSAVAMIALLVTGCKKVDPLPYYNDGSKVNVTASRTFCSASIGRLADIGAYLIVDKSQLCL
jgi:hypothetical protein